jgi:hypothetical protein
MRDVGGRHAGDAIAIQVPSDEVCCCESDGGEGRRKRCRGRSETGRPPVVSANSSAEDIFIASVANANHTTPTRPVTIASSWERAFRISLAFGVRIASMTRAGLFFTI